MVSDITGNSNQTSPASLVSDSDSDGYLHPIASAVETAAVAQLTGVTVEPPYQNVPNVATGSNAKPRCPNAQLVPAKAAASSGSDGESDDYLHPIASPLDTVAGAHLTGATARPPWGDVLTVPVVTGGQPLYQNILNVATGSRTATHGPKDPQELTDVGTKQGDPRDPEKNTRTAAELRDPNDPEESPKARACESRSLDDPGEPHNDRAESFYQNVTDMLTAAAGKGLHPGPRT